MPPAGQLQPPQAKGSRNGARSLEIRGKRVEGSSGLGEKADKTTSREKEKQYIQNHWLRRGPWWAQSRATESGGVSRTQVRLGDPLLLGGSRVHGEEGLSWETGNEGRDGKTGKQEQDEGSSRSQEQDTRTPSLLSLSPRRKDAPQRAEHTCPQGTGMKTTAFPRRTAAKRPKLGIKESPLAEPPSTPNHHQVEDNC